MPLKNICNYLTLIFLLLGPPYSQAQTITITGKVSDRSSPLPNANILAKPSEKDIQMRFAISKPDGSYSLELKKDVKYEICISYLGYKAQILEVTATKDLVQDFALKEDTNELDEVVLNYKIPLVVKEDTLVYNVSSFANGKERKLREVLKKLPGVEVDREGNVSVKGKKVTKVLVEDKTFFTGDSKLAVNNIPANAVEKLEVLDNYTEVPFLKGLKDSDEMAMNIKLKEDKKKFAFGDLELGGGPDKHYLAHPSLFYYSTKTTVNFIGDLNNIGEKSFTFKDFIDFEGGYSNLLSGSGSFRNLFNSDLYQFINNTDFKENINRFGAFNIMHGISRKTDLNAYFIGVNNESHTEVQTKNTYTTDTPFDEERQRNNNLKNKFLLGKITLDHEPEYGEDLSLNTRIKLTQNNTSSYLNTVNPFQNNSINTLADATGFDIGQNISYHRKFNAKHTGTLEAGLNYNKSKPDVNWVTNQPILQDLIPLDEDDIYHIYQRKEIENINFNAIAKDYWVLNNFNHIYPSIGVNLELNSFYTNEEQLLSDNSINNFNSAGFGNDFTYNFSDIFTGIEYKFQKGIFVFKPSLFYHFYNWQAHQVNEYNNKFKTLLLPQFLLKAKIKNSEKVDFSYKLNARFPTVNQLANRYTLNSFNSVSKGNAYLENSLYHSFSLSYYKFSLYNNLYLNARVHYSRKQKNIKSISVLDGIDQYATYMLLDNPENTFRTNFQVRKKINTLRYNLKTDFNYNDYIQSVNGILSGNISKRYTIKPSITTFFNDKWPQFDFGYGKTYSNYQTPYTTTNFESDEIFADLEYIFFKDFVFKADYSYDTYKNKSTGNTNYFDMANASLFYQKEDSAWGFEISGSNLFNVQYKQDNFFSDYLIQDKRTYILPRIFLLKIIYKL